MNHLTDLIPLIAQIENISPQGWITWVTTTIAGAMAFMALKDINNKLSLIIDKITRIEIKQEVHEVRIQRLEEDNDDK